MRVTVTQTGTLEIDPEVYKEWLADTGDKTNWDNLSNQERLGIIKQCEEECGYGINEQIVDWKTDITLS